MKNFTILRNRLATLLLTLSFVSSVNLFAQQEPMYSQYMFNTLAINPAYAGSRDVLSFTALYRAQWLSVPGAPTTMTATLDMPFKNEKMGIGLQVYNDQIAEGRERSTGTYLTYAYRVRVSPRTTLSFGVQGGVANMHLNLADLKDLTDSDPDIAFGAVRNRWMPNVGGGIFLSNDRSYFGFSVPQIIQHPFATRRGSDSANVVGDAKVSRHYYAMMGFVLGKGAFKVKPSTVLRYTAGAPLGVDGNINLWIKDKIAFGVSGRISQFKTIGQTEPFDAVVGMIELQLTPQLKVGYAYDATLNKLNKSQGSNRLVTMPTHEGMLRYEFGYGKNKILTPRYF